MKLTYTTTLTATADRDGGTITTTVVVTTTLVSRRKLDEHGIGLFKEEADIEHALDVGRTHKGMAKKYYPQTIRVEKAKP